MKQHFGGSSSWAPALTGGRRAPGLPSFLKIVTLLMLMLIGCETSAWAFDYEYKGLRYRLYSERGVQWAELIAPKTGSYTGDVVIDSVVVYEPTHSYEVVKDKNYPVTGIYRAAFMNAKELTSVTMPEGMDSLGARAFYGCKALTSIVLPSSVTKTGNAVFANCKGLKSVTLSSRMTEIADSAFTGCTALESVTIPSAVTTICREAFMGCAALKSVSIPASVTSIRYSAFQNCAALETVRLPENLTELGRSESTGGVFEKCTSLRSINIPESLKVIGNWTFYGCTSLTEAVLPSWAADKYLGNNLFRGCSSLRKVVIPEGWNLTINMFEGCTSLESIKLPESTTKIPNRCFYGCTSLREINIPASAYEIGMTAFLGCTALTRVVMSQGVRYIREEAFAGCTSLAQVGMLNTVQTIDEESYSNCSALTYIEIPYGVQSIEDKAFSGCTGIKAMVIPETVTSLGTSCVAPNVTHVLSLANLSKPYYSYSPFNETCVIFVPDTKKSYYTHKSELLKTVFFAKTTCTTITFKAEDGYVFTKGTLKQSGNVFFERNADAEGNICFDGLPPNTSYGAILEGEFYGIPFVANMYNNKPLWTRYFMTNDLKYEFTLLSRTNSTLRVKAACIGDVDIVKYALTVKNVTYEGQDEASVDGLLPDTRVPCRFAVTLKDGKTYWSEEKNFYTEPVDITVESETTASSLTLTGTYSVIDAEVVASGFDETEASTGKWTGLDPNTSYTHTYYVQVRAGKLTKKCTKSVTVKLPALQIETLQPKGLTATSTMVAGKANIDDAETGAGFQWRKYDAPSTLKSSEGYAPVYDGCIEGYIKNLSATSYYNVRAFYKSAAGTCYYGDWVTFDPSDFSYFEPTVHTYALVQVIEGTARVGGVALPGSSEILEQGFEYWPVTRARSAGVKTVQASGQRMEAELTGLASKTTYSVRAYARTTTGTTYGETVQFTTPVLTAIDGVTTTEAVDLSLMVRPGGSLQIAVSGSRRADCAFRVVNANGGQVATGTVSADGTWQTLVAHKLRPGIYMVSVDDGHDRRVKKVLVR